MKRIAQWFVLPYVIALAAVIAVFGVMGAGIFAAGAYQQQEIALQEMGGGVGSTTTTCAASILKIDDAATDGLLGTVDSLAYRVHEIEHHFHSGEVWFGVAETASGEDHVADRIDESQASFQIDAGNDDWSTWQQILGPLDTPAATSIETGVKFDLHRIAVVSVQNANSDHFVQVACGTSGDAAYLAGMVTEFVFRPLSVQADAMIYEIQMPHQDVDTKCWLRLLVDTKNTSLMNYYFGIHEYPGS